MATDRGPKGWGRRLADQVALIREAFPEIGIHPPDWRPGVEIDYLYREGVVLVRDEDLERVQSLVPGQVDDGLIRGLTRYRPAGLTTGEALERIERALGRDVATPDHLVSVCPRSLCPAKEPQPVTAAADPVPPTTRERGCDGRGVLVVVVDTGWLHGAEQAAPWTAGVDGDPETGVARGTIAPYAGHGTFIAGVVRTMAPRADVYVERVAHRAGAWFESDMIDQLDEALARGADVISLSAGTNTKNDSALLAFSVWYETRLKQRPDVVLVAAAGNDGTRRPFWPAAFGWALSVGATNLAGTARPGWSNYGSWVQVSAPGEDLVNAFPTGSYTYSERPDKGSSASFRSGLASWSGTSFSAPLVAGLIAARMSGTGASAPVAAAELLRIARGNRPPGIGPVLMPGDACRETPCGCGAAA